MLRSKHDMTCRQAEEQLMTYLNDGLRHDALEALEAHLATCPSCATALRGARGMVRELEWSATCAPRLLPETAGRVRMRVYQRLRRSIMISRVSRLAWGAIGLAVAILLAAGLYAHIGMVPEQGTPAGPSPLEDRSVLPTSPSPRAQIPPILFVSNFRDDYNRSQHYGLAELNPASGQITWVSRPQSTPPYPAAPLWAPDGSGLVYHQRFTHPIFQPGLFEVRVTIEGQPGDVTLYFVDRDGEEQPLFHASAFYSVVWAATGEGVYVIVPEAPPWAEESDSASSARLLYVPLSGDPVVLAEEVVCTSPSPDGAWVAYVLGDGQDPATAYRIHLQPAGGGEATVLSERFVGPGRDEVLLRPAGDQVTVLADAPRWASGLAWSPDSRWLAYTAGEQDTFRPVLVDPSSGQVRNLTTEPLQLYHYVWSPRGERIAAAGPEGLYLLRPDGGTPLRLSDRQTGGIAWSPDGTRLAYVAYDVVAYPVSSEEEHRWSEHEFRDPVLHLHNLGEAIDQAYPTGLVVTPRWSPDGLWLLFADLFEGGRDTFNRTNLHVLNVQTGERIDLGEPGDAMDPVWVTDAP